MVALRIPGWTWILRSTLAISETIILKLDHVIASLNPFAPDHAEQLEKYQAEKLTFQLVEYRQRMKKHPTDYGFRYELGALYFQAGKITEAIAELQKAQQNAHKRCSAISYLAQCFAKRGMNDSGVRTLQSTIKEKPVFDEEKRDLIYNLGCVFEKMGKKAEAIEQFLILYESDVTYRDVGARVDAHHAGQWERIVGRYGRRQVFGGAFSLFLWNALNSKFTQQVKNALSTLEMNITLKESGRNKHEGCAENYMTLVSGGMDCEPVLGGVLVPAF